MGRMLKEGQAPSNTRTSGTAKKGEAPSSARVLPQPKGTTRGGTSNKNVKMIRGR